MGNEQILYAAALCLSQSLFDLIDPPDVGINEQRGTILGPDDAEVRGAVCADYRKSGFPQRLKCDAHANPPANFVLLSDR
jgi:hypothetical protein